MLLGVDAVQAIAGPEPNRKGSAKDGRKVRAPKSAMPANGRWRERQGTVQQRIDRPAAP
jgi:hypothetical protein